MTGVRSELAALEGACECHEEEGREYSHDYICRGSYGKYISILVMNRTVCATADVFYSVAFPTTHNNSSARILEQMDDDLRYCRFCPIMHEVAECSFLPRCILPMSSIPRRS